ncbi:MAG TPA: helix-turn-helix transcriptional regulator [Candidatus Dormibacteraeota bacterium]|nr:helix-turn-helix transcriptional regulator [Candidatus Dormibacteraeota bacterium]
MASTNNMHGPKTLRRRLPGVTLKPGSVKQARQEAGLSLAQVGKGHVTAPAIYLIETGRTRPSLPTLEHIAHRTGKPVEFFLANPGGTIDESQAMVAELEAMVADGRYNEAIELGRSLLDLGSSAYRLGRIRYFVGLAHLQVGQPDRAVDLLAEARAHFEATNDGVMLAECLGAEASLAYMIQRPDALVLAEKALSVCRSLKPVPTPTEARLLGIVAGAHVANLEWDKAIDFYEASIEAAGSYFDLRRLAKMYSGLSFAYHELGQIDVAARYASRSVALLDVLRDSVSLARSENNLGLILIARGELSAAREHLDRSLELSEASELEVGRSHVLLSLCELCLEEGNLEQAREFAGEALALAGRLHEGPNVAEAHMWLGRIADRQGNHETTDHEFAQAIHCLEQLGTNERLFRCHGTYAEILERRGDVARAYLHMKKALQATRPGLLQSQQEDQQEHATTA